MSSRALWQQPYVNVFKHTKIEEWKKVSKEGDVTTYMDKSLKCSVFRIRGSIPASNYILLPKTSSQTLGLTGRYLYLLFRPSPNKHFIVHLDVAAEEGQVIRISFSNMFKEFKSTATWLQFPFLCGAAHGSVYDNTASSVKHGLVGPAPPSTRWTCLTMDLRFVLSVYLNKTHSHLKSVKLCANMSVKNIVTSDLQFDPGLSFTEFRQSGVMLPDGSAPMPREMCFPVPKGQSWHQFYDYIKFPSDGTRLPFDSIQKASNSETKKASTEKSPQREENHAVNISKPVQDRVSLIQQITSPKAAPSTKQRSVIQTACSPELIHTRSIGSESSGSPGQRSQAGEEVTVVRADDAGIHVYARCEDDVYTDSTDSEEEVTVINAASPRPVSLSSDKLVKPQKLYPDPILRLNRIIGFGGATVRCAVWSSDGEEVVYPSHAIIISMTVSSGQQRFFIGHTDKVSALALNANSTVLASAQTGTNSLIRLWSFSAGVCQTIIPTHTHALNLLSFSHSGGVLCGVGKDSHNKTTVILWGTRRVCEGSVVPVLAKAHTDVDIQAMTIAFFDETRMVSCGLGNVRLWRVRGGSLRSCPVNLGQYHNLEFTDLAFEQGHTRDRPVDDRTLFVSSRSGHILEIDYVAVAIKNIRRLLPAQETHTHQREKQTFSTGTGIAVNSISVCAEFCVTGSADGFLRLWPLDFSSVFLEAEHEGPVSLVCVSSDGSRVLAATSAGNLGYLDVSSRGYRTLMRSHTASVLGFSVDGVRRRVTTVSRDSTVRVWDMDTMQQLYDFVPDADEIPCSVAFHPSMPLFTCGSSSGLVRVFDIQTSSLIAQHRQHCGAVECVIYSPDGQCLFSTDDLGYLVLHSSSEHEHPVVRVLGNVVARGVTRGPDALSVSSDSRCLALVGPTEYIVTIMETQTLNELLRVDVSILDVESSTLDSALNVCFSPASLSHLLVTTSANKILWIDTRTGQLLRQVSEVHKRQCVSLAVSDDGRYLLTAGQNCLKVWDYDMQLDVNSQVFIGHSEPIRQVRFTPDQMGVVTVGDALFFWDFLAPPLEDEHHRSPSIEVSSRKSAHSWTELNESELSNEKPREAAVFQPSSPPVMSFLSSERKDSADFLCDSTAELHLSPTSGHAHSPAKHASFLRVTEWVADDDTPTTPADQSGTERIRESHAEVRPDCYKHFTPRFKSSVLDQSVVTPPTGQAGLSLKAVIGYNGNGRNNIVWNPDSGLFVYTCGCVVIVEDLHTGSQKQWFGHTEEISTLAVTHDALTVASASGGGASHNCLICIWNVQDGSCRNRLSFHKGAVQSLAFSRDDMYLLSVGDYSQQVVALWSTRSFELLCSVQMCVPLHDACFCPFTADELTLVGGGAVVFTRIQTHNNTTEFQVQKVGLPDAVGQAEVTSLCYNTRRILYTGTNSGHVCVWDCNTQRCFVTWEADRGEIGVLVCRGSKLVTGSNTKKLRLWSVASLQNLRNSNHKSSRAQDDGAQVQLEQELQLDGTVVSAGFDEVMDMGIVGTTAGTLWYINWADSTSIRLISGHKSKVNGVVCSPDEQHFVTCGQDGSVRVWTLQSHELLVQFQVLNQSCECVCWTPPRGVYESSGRVCVAGGYSDGTVRIFSLDSAEMELKLQPQPVCVRALQFSHYGHVLLSGGRDGVITVSSPVTGVTVRTITDHKGANITTVQCTSKQYKEFGLEGNELWLAVSADRRVSIWAADWTKNQCELLDWLTFPAPKPSEDFHTLPPSLAAFSPSDRGTVVYTGYAVEKEIIFYCLYKKQVLRTISLSDWALSLSLCSTGRLLAVGSNQRVLKLIHSSTGRFQDFASHSDSVHVCGFSSSGSRLFTAAHSELYLWTLHGL